MCLAVPGELLGIDDDDALTRHGRVAFGGIVKQVNLAYVPDARPRDYVLVHAGFAIAVIDEIEASRMLDALGALDPEEPCP
ncbi:MULTISPECIES: HypC/HybG/HupF family hydrogenase formation chaperone [unclassified Burkholderia]|uniref:HypC/HybG/HupF family hydrogenase formation chaperone n=1 Tax=unclassified Burkholderia TaxID=2613784 RepID=UPI00075E0D5C|nr:MULTISPECIES: HypC/HybG/HupF family hydrogenase formation chaperone [unclassified Burkholderia]KUY61054.1 hydrogenase assembly protein HupF [Burkholderia sp. RF2-non_BP3]KUY85973.1 hydrogenase assembly protein HupF [Burkholderia sp. RF4-BP95]KUY92847.1 hydrogenase assembly protein HupF [Burkholderia sp. RF7-non_BP4]KUY95356.1 hydrogenase assembly protein HupF [Burkholderia sp. RF7-non_BP1]